MKIINKKYMSFNFKVHTGIIALVFLFSNTIWAQVEDLKTDEEVMVIAPFNPSISKAKKLSLSPQIDTNRADRLPIDYLSQSKLFETNYSVEKLTAAKFIDRRSPKSPQNYIKAGFGLNTTAYGEFFLNNSLSKSSQMGIHLKHLSTQGNIDDYAWSSSSVNSAKIWTKHIQRKQTTHLSASYKRNHIHRYGFLIDDYPVALANTNNDFKDDIKQTFSNVGIALKMLGTYDKRFRNWEANLNYHYFWDRYRTQEHILDFTAYYNHPVEWFDVPEQHIGVEFSTQTYNTNFDYSGLNTTIDSSTNYFHGLYDITPYYHMDWESFNLEVGAKLSMALDSNSNVALAPRVKLEVKMMDDDLKAYLQMGGGYHNNSLYHLSNENNFISPIVPLNYSQTTYDVKLGVKGHYLSFLDYHIFLETSDFKDMPMFITDTTAQYDNSFTAIYDGGQKIGGGIELLFNTERWNVELMGKYQSFSMDTATYAWQKPNLIYKFKVGYFVLENLKVTGLLLGQSKMYNWYNGERTVEPWMDFSLMADYHLNKELGFFLKATNIFSDQYMLWDNYPVQSFGVMAGLHFAF